MTAQIISRSVICGLLLLSVMLYFQRFYKTFSMIQTHNVGLIALILLLYRKNNVFRTIRSG